MLKLLIQLALISYAAAANDVKGCIACAAGTIAFKTTKAGCATCTAVPNQAKTAVLSCSIKADNSGAEKSSLGKGGGTRECLEGFFFTAQAGSADATCVACGDPSCITCSGTGAGKCTGPQPGFYLDSGVPKACTAVTDCAKGHQTQTVAEMCPTASPKTAKPTKDISGVCTACASVAPAKSKFSLLSTGKGCATCPTVADAAKGVTYECTEDTGKDTHEKGTLKVVAAASGDDAGRKCKPGFFYTQASGTTDAKCTACATNCKSCTSSTVCTDADTYFFLKSDAPVNCDTMTNELCKANETLKRACTKKPAPGGSSSIAQVSMLVAVVSVLFSF